MYVQSNTGLPYWFSVPSTITHQSMAIVDSIQQEGRVEEERHSGNQYQTGIINSALKWQRRQGCDAFTLMLTRGLHFSLQTPSSLLLQPVLALMVPSLTHTHGLIANPCKGQLLLCAEPAVTHRVRRLKQTAAVTMINHLALSFTCR